MIRKLQLFISNCTDPYKNLAAEKYLFDTVPDDCCTLYLWQNRQTVVIGQNQNPWAECRCSLLKSEGGHLARRLSGGGAVFHDLGNLNFTFLCTAENYDLNRQLKVIQTACESAGITAEISGRNDILAGGRKFSGNAFYHSGGKSYHHGTLLISADMKRMQRYLTPSNAKLKSKGVKSVKSRVVNLSEIAHGLTCQAMKQYMISAFEKVYGLPAVMLQNVDSDRISQLADEYSSWSYLYGTPLHFTLSCEERFAWGSAQLNLQIKHGIIQAVKLYTDSMDWQIPQQVEAALLHCRFDPIAAEEALASALPQALAEDFYSLLKNHAFN